MELDEIAEKVGAREELATFIPRLQNELVLNPHRWENCSLPAYLDALAAWVEDMDGYFKNRGEPVPASPTWKLVGQMLLAAGMYE